jgi:hypothetical protein
MKLRGIVMNIVDDLRRDLSLTDYNDAMKRFVELCFKCGITDDRIAFFGSISCPGVSDIDVAILSSPRNIKKLINMMDKECQQSPSFDYMFWHQPVYILDDLLNDAKFLHTLENLQPLVPDGFFNSSSLYIDEKDREIINISWFCFLINTYLNIKMKVTKREKTSLRLILLVYKNLFHSYLLFTDDRFDIDVITPHEMRLKILHDGLDVHKIDLWENFNKLFTLSAKQFDKFCLKKLSSTSKNGKIISTLVTPSCVWSSSYSTSVYTGQFISKIRINKPAFLFINDYFYGTHHITQSRNYLVSTKKCEKNYSKVCISYQFIRPITIPNNYFKKWLFNIANRSIMRLRIYHDENPPY